MPSATAAAGPLAGDATAKTMASGVPVRVLPTAVVVSPRAAAAAAAPAGWVTPKANASAVPVRVAPLALVVSPSTALAAAAPLGRDTLNGFAPVVVSVRTICRWAFRVAVTALPVAVLMAD